MMTHILMSSYKESTERRKTSFLKETVENADLHKAVLKNKNDHTRIVRKIRFRSSFKMEGFMFFLIYFLLCELLLLFNEIRR